MELRITPPQGPLNGELLVPSDKSISHRAVLFAAMAEGTSHLVGVLDSADVRATIGAVRALGADVVVESRESGGLRLAVTGWGAQGPHAPDEPIDCANSGTTARLLMGVLAGWPIEVTLIGDVSLSRRPMRRVADPLETMGASIETAPGGTLPATVHGGDLAGIQYRSPVASAQVKTAILLAGLRATGRTTVFEPALSRDHTERLLPAFGVPVQRLTEGNGASVSGPVDLVACDVSVPADPSSAAFFAVAAALVPGSTVSLPGVSTNPTRNGFVGVLERMGMRLEYRNARRIGAEPVADMVVRHRALRATTVLAAEIPSLVDEVPVLALAATAASGTSRFQGVGELRLKESDRLEATADGLHAFGAIVAAGDDWIEVTGPTPLRGARVSSLGDHRLAMTWALAGLIAPGETFVEGFSAVEVSYPGFARDLARLGAPVEWA